MKRPSQVIERLVSGMDALAGECNAKSNERDFVDKVIGYNPGYIFADVALVNANAIMTEVARGIEYCIAKPLYHLENLVVGKRPNPGWTFG